MRVVERISQGFRFKRYEEFNAPREVFEPEFDDRDWEEVRVPHDWAIRGEFKESNDISYREIVADGIKTPITHSGRTGALPILGQGVYRRWIRIPQENEKRYFLEFDGVMWEAEIYVNGKRVAFNHFGYKSFSVDITDYVSFGEQNLVAVGASVFHDCSRWYPGAGIYRNVYLVQKASNHITYNGVWIRQLEIGKDNAVFELSLDYVGPDTLSFEADILSPEGDVVTTVSHKVFYGELSDIFTIDHVRLWDVDEPNLYTANIRLLDAEGNVLDEVSEHFGARRCVFTAEKGMFLNNRPLKIKGVCLHHDLGSLGAAVNVAAMRRQLQVMQKMGVNSIRTSHNPPAPELLDLCDEMGILVMDEFFDEWYTAKIQNGYAKYFRERAVEDMRDIMHRDRNHPSVIMWSLGNEMLEQYSKEGWRVTKHLYEAARAIDPTRPITCGFSCPTAQFDNHMVNYVDVVGINYKPHLYETYHEEHPDLKFIATETASTVSSRGVYHLPAEISNPVHKREDLSISSYELEAPDWACYAERELGAQKDCEFMAGEYVWTGFDYLGEPTPYYSEWPARSSYFGICDIAGLPKNRFYLYQACWTDTPVLHIFPHWNWEGKEGEPIPVHVFTNYDRVELFLNDVSMGVQTLRKNRGESEMEQVERFRMIWENVPYAPGTLKAVAYDEDGNAVKEAEVRTAGKPSKIQLEAERTEMKADGEDVVYITATITDENGIPCPHATDRLYFHVEGPTEVLTTDNGDQRETESFWRADKKAHAGKCVVCCRSVVQQAGEFIVRCSADGLSAGEVALASNIFK